MEYRALGNTGIEVSVLGFGGAEIGYEGASDAEVERIVGSALNAGVNVFDTAECYVDSEEKLGRVLENRRESVYIFSKCGHASGLSGADWDAGVLAESINRSLKRLRTSHLDLIQLHSCSEAILRAGEVTEVLVRAREAGKVRFIGYSGDSTDALYAVQSNVFDTLQTSINIADQEAVELVLPQAQARRMGVIAKRSIANAAWKYDELPPNAYHHTYWTRLRELKYDFLTRTPQDAVSIALRFTLAVPGVSMAIVGTKNPDRWAGNLAITDSGPIGPELYESIRRRWSEAAKPDWVGQV